MTVLATVDSLEVVIESDAEKAIDQLDLLAEKLGKVSAALSSIGNSPGIKQLTEKLAGLQSGMTKNMKDIGRPIEQQTKKASKSLSQIFEVYEDLGKGLSFTGNVPALQKQLDSYTNLLQKALLKESELGAAGNTGGKMYEYAMKDILKYSNLIEGLQGQIENMKASAASQKMDFPIEMPGEQSWNLEDFKASLEEMQGLIAEGFGGRQ